MLQNRHTKKKSQHSIIHSQRCSNSQMDLIMCEIIQPRDNILQVWRFLVGDVRGRAVLRNAAIVGWLCLFQTIHQLLQFMASLVKGWGLRGGGEVEYFALFCKSLPSWLLDFYQFVVFGFRMVSCFCLSKWCVPDMCSVQGQLLGYRGRPLLNWRGKG